MVAVQDPPTGDQSSAVGSPDPTRHCQTGTCESGRRELSRSSARPRSGRRSIPLGPGGSAERQVAGLSGTSECRGRSSALPPRRLAATNGNGAATATARGPESVQRHRLRRFVLREQRPEARMVADAIPALVEVELVDVATGRPGNRIGSASREAQGWRDGESSGVSAGPSPDLSGARCDAPTRRSADPPAAGRTRDPRGRRSVLPTGLPTRVPGT